jgi:uncharacterized protein YjiS (DUF1127 family)
MAQALKKSVPGITAAHLAAFTSLSDAPELHIPSLGGRNPGFRAEVLYPHWWRNPAIVMRGWRPREIEWKPSWSERITEAAAAAVGQVREWRERARSRRALLTLDDYMLRDLGIDRATAQYMGSRPFWRADD